MQIQITLSDDDAARADAAFQKAYGLNDDALVQGLKRHISQTVTNVEQVAAQQAAMEAVAPPPPLDLDS